MTVEIKDGITHITADEGAAIHRIGSPAPSCIVGTTFRVGTDDAANWEDCELGNPKGEDMKYSTLSIKRELAALGKWDAAKALMESSGVWDDYILANYLAENDPVFVAAKTAFVAAGILTQAQLDDLLPKCVWTAD